MQIKQKNSSTFYLKNQKFLIKRLKIKFYHIMIRPQNILLSLQLLFHFPYMYFNQIIDFLMELFHLIIARTTTQMRILGPPLLIMILIRD